jgi:beta-barrel assembly-enhancing protease
MQEAVQQYLRIQSLLLIGNIPSPQTVRNSMLNKLPAKLRLPLILLLVVGAALGVYSATKAPSAPTVGSAKQTALTTEQLDARDVEIGQLIHKKYGSESADITQRDLVGRIGNAIATKTDAKDAARPVRFHLLADANAINLFALSSGDVYVTTALVNRMRTEGELASALANGAAHVLASHHMHLPEAPAALIPQFTVEQESSVDARAVKIMADAGYSPNAMLGMFEILTTAYQAGADTQFFTTHPSVDGRLTTIKEAIDKLYPKGVPDVLSK